MKKLLSIAALIAFTTTGLAQHRPILVNAHGPHPKENRHYAPRKNDHKRDRNHYAFDDRQREIEINKIMRKYQMRIDMVNSDWRYKKNAKRKIVKELIRERDREIRLVWDKFNHPHNYGRRF